MTRILALLNTIPVDKLLHFFVGFVLSVIVVPLFDWVGVLIVIVVAALKELFFDHYLNRGKLEMADFIWTVVPSFILLIFKYL